MPSLVHPKETIYFAISLMVSLLLYAGVLLWAVKSLESIAVMLFYVLLFAMLSFIVKGLFLGYVRGNGIRVSPTQFPEVYKAAQRLAGAMELDPLPAMYVLQSGGVLNAFATRFLGRNFVILNSAVLEVALEKGEAEVDFVLCHELAHIKRKHMTWRTLLFPSAMIPLLSAAYSRGCEYTCDRFGAHYVPQGAAGGLAVLAAGGRLFRIINLQEFSDQSRTERGLWVWYAEILASHPHLTKRLRAVQEFRAGQGAVAGAVAAS